MGCALVREKEGRVQLVVAVAELIGSHWKLVDALVLHSWTPPEFEGSPVRVTLRSADYDGDGEPELLVRYRWTQICGGIGEASATDLSIVDHDCAGKVGVG